MSRFELRLVPYCNNESRTTALTSYSREPIFSALKLMGFPDRQFKSILVTGTNGKGTVASSLHALLWAHGIRSGLYTSPHLLRVNERIRLDAEITDEEAISILDFIESVTEGISLTYFDILTLIAFEYFKNSRVTYAILETGLGGTLDSTTVVNPLLSIITDISLDHTHILGRTIEEIAHDKSGVIRSNTPVLSSSQDESVKKILKKRAADNNAPFLQYGVDYTMNQMTSSDTQLYTYRNKTTCVDSLSLLNGGEAFSKNIATSIQALMLLVNTFDHNRIHKTLSSFCVPGRFEILSHNPPVYYDVAHNTASFRNLLVSIQSLFHGQKIRLFVSFMSDKDTERLLQLAVNSPHTVIYCTLPDKRSFHPHSSDVDVIVSANDHQAIRRLIDSTIPSVFCGTFRLYHHLSDIIVYD